MDLPAVSDHKLTALAVLSSACRGVGAEMLEARRAWSSRGVFLRLWAPDWPAVNAVMRAAQSVGLKPQPPVRHIWEASDSEHDGWQLCIPVPWSAVAQLAAAVETRAAAREIGSGT